jgi:glyoxylase-like metal-dependent hydrolase (beta-lactamase superfamily II)
MRLCLTALALILAASSAVFAQQPSAPPPPAAPATQAPAPPPFSTTKVEGTENVYIFRYGGHQSMFVVTTEGVIATDPIAYLRPQAATTYVQEIKKITDAPIRYLIYSHHHYDHIAGGKRFKDEGATIVAHKLAKEHLARLANPDALVPDETVDDKKTITLGGTELELLYVGRNHSDNSLVMRLPKEKLIFAVDFIPVGAVPFRNMLDSWIPDWEESIKRVMDLDWDRLIPGHPGPGGRLGTRDDVKTLQAYMQDLSDAVKTAASQGKCWDTAMQEVKLPRYQNLAQYAQYLSGNVERYCSHWARGY